MKGTSYPLSVLRIFLVVVVTLLTLITLSGRTNAATSFVTSWQTDAGGSTNKTITIPTYSTATYNYSVDWGDGQTTSGHAADASHTYANDGNYTVSISGTFPRIYFNNGGDKLKIKSVEFWGDNAWTSMVDAFEGCKNLVVNATDAPDLSVATSLSGMFSGASSLNQPLGHWDVSNIDNFSYMFENASSFNQDISTWDVGSSQSFLGMFSFATAFNQNINSWDTSRASSFNSMFQGASSFNQPVNGWNTSEVTDTRFMFDGAANFNQDVSSWRFPKNQKTEYMFRNATNFNQDVSLWDMNVLERADYMFTNSAFSTKNYDRLLKGWSQDSIRNNVVLDAGPAKYCSGKLAREYLVNTKNWMIFDKGFDPASCSPTDIVFDNENQPTIMENQAAGTLIGGFITSDPDQDDTFTYSLNCTVGTFSDSQFFTITNGQLATNAVFNFSSPQDDNKDNIYEICVRSEDSSGMFVEKTFTVTISDQEDPVPPTVTVSGGQVLGTSTTATSNNAAQTGQPKVLGDATTAGLSDTGKGVIATTLVGLMLVLSVALSSKKRKVYKLY